MPRHPRDDLEPEILLSDTNEQQRLATGVIDQDHFRVQVYDRNQAIGRERRIYFFDAFDHRLQQCRDDGIKLDEGLLNFMMRQCELADVRVKRNPGGDPIVQDRQIVHRLVRVGCRMRMTQDHIASRFGLSRQTVNQRIGIFRDWYFIVNQGRGWYEFDATLCWRGNLAICAAYREVQRVRDGIVIADGATTLAAEHSDSNESEDHSPQGAEEEEEITQ
jgi:hypothetical protein